MSSDSTVPKKVLLQKRGRWASAHLSMFPATNSEAACLQWKEDKAVDFTGMHRNICSIEIALTNGRKFEVPANLMYYIQERMRHGPKFTYVVPFELAQALAGSVGVQVYSAESDFVNSDSKSVGWIEYAHADGKAYSATEVSISFTVQTYETTCNDQLMEFGELHNSIPTADASMLSEAQRKTYYQYVIRMWTLFQLANQHPSFPPNELQDFWNKDDTADAVAKESGVPDAKNHYAKLLKDDSKAHDNLYIQFPPIDVIGFETVDGKIVIKEEAAIKPEPEPEQEQEPKNEKRRCSRFLKKEDQ